MGDRTTWPARFWAKVDATGDCWQWTGAGGGKGYGSCRDELQRVKSAHRVAWTLLVGEISAGLVIDHLCRNRLCVNPDHLDLVTNKTNVLRGVGPTAHNARKVICSCGEPFERTSTGRVCRSCARERARIWWSTREDRGKTT